MLRLDERRIADSQFDDLESVEEVLAFVWDALTMFACDHSEILNNNARQDLLVILSALNCIIVTKES